MPAKGKKHCHSYFYCHACGGLRCICGKKKVRNRP